MTTDLVTRDDGLAPEVIGSAYQLAEQVSKTEFVPGALRNRPEAVMACILTGREVGIGPMQALSKIHVVDGRPAMAAELMRSLALSAGHEIWYEEKSATRVTVAGRRNGSDRVSKVTWTMDDAKRAGIQGKNNWRKYPRAMLTARATSELCRDIFADCLGGVSYSVEEISDGGFEDTTGEGDPIDEKPAKSTPAKRATVRRSPPRREQVAPRSDDGPLLPHELDADANGQGQGQGQGQGEVIDVDPVEDGDGEDEDFASMTVAQLRLRCKNLGLPTSGKKDELVTRLREATSGSAPSPEEPETGNGQPDAPPPPDDEGDSGLDPHLPKSITEAQLTKLQTLFRELGIRRDTPAGDNHYRASLMALYGIDSSKHLSKNQARGLIEILEHGRVNRHGVEESPGELARQILEAGARRIDEQDQADVDTSDQETTDA